MTPFENTYCNPIPLPDYPRGACTYGDKPTQTGFLQNPPKDFRETADPSVLYWNNTWYLYPSCGMAWVSEDFRTWTHHRIEPYNIGYAPTVVEHRGRFLLTACHAPIFTADHPLGPFKELGKLRKPDGAFVEPFADPMLFADDDGRLYAYWGLSTPGIFGAEVDAADPTQLITEPKILFAYNPDHIWERYGANNENPSQSFVEGSWMIRIGSRYFLTYAAPGTEFPSYGMGAYVSDGPLGPFTYQQHNPILQQRHGLVRGPGHGCIVRGPNETLWAFYTCVVCYEHIFERRIGFDAAGVDANGELFVQPATETPQWAPGVKTLPQTGNISGLVYLSQGCRTRATSHVSGRPPFYAVDGTMTTWWQPADTDTTPAMEIQLNGRFDVSAFRVIWKDVGLDYEGGVLPGPFHYRIRFADAETEPWTTVFESDPSKDMLIDYQTFTTRRVTRVRLEILGTPPGIRPGLVDYSVFGNAIAE